MRGWAVAVVVVGLACNNQHNKPSDAAIVKQDAFVPRDAAAACLPEGGQCGSDADCCALDCITNGPVTSCGGCADGCSEDFQECCTGACHYGSNGFSCE
jgi:hypothetical protein